MKKLIHSVSAVSVAVVVGVGTAALGADPAAPPSAPPVKASVAVRVSTLGLGLEGSVLVTPNLALRAGYNGYTYSHAENYQDIDYDGKLKLSSVPVFADLYPSANSGFHVTAGILFNSNTLTAHGKPSVSAGTQTYTLNGTAYSAADVGSLDGRVSFSKTSPYLGIGFGKPSGGGSMLQFLFDVGIVFQGKPNLTLSRSGGTTDPTLSSLINTAVSAQRDKTQSDVNKFQYYPVLSFGLAYHF